MFGQIGIGAYSTWESGKFIIVSNNINPTTNNKLNLNEIEVVLNVGLSTFAQELANKYPNVIFKDFNGKKYDSELPSLEEDLQEVWKIFDSIPKLKRNKEEYMLVLPSQIQTIANAVIVNNDILDNDLIKSIPAISEFNRLYKLPNFKSILDKIISNEIKRLKNPNENSNDPINRGDC